MHNTRKARAITAEARDKLGAAQAVVDVNPGDDSYPGRRR
jgi:hypothetical protein